MRPIRYLRNQGNGIVKISKTNTWVSSNNVKFIYEVTDADGTRGIATVQPTDARDGRSFVSGRSYLATLVGYEENGVPIYRTNGNSVAEFEGMSYSELKDRLTNDATLSDYSYYVSAMDAIFEMAKRRIRI
jgi:hypothetical protein